MNTIDKAMELLNESIKLNKELLAMVKEQQIIIDKMSKVMPQLRSKK